MRKFLKSINSYNFCNTPAKPEYLYGINPIQLAFAANRRKLQVLIVSDNQAVNTSYRVTKIINLARQRKVPVVFNSKDKMNSIVKGQPHQNMIVKCSSFPIQYADSPQTYPEGIYILCDKITDPQNIGAIIRSSLFYGAKAIFISKKNSSPLNSTVSKASSGAMQLMQIYTINREEQYLKMWKENSGLIITTSVNQQTTRPITPAQCRELVKNNINKYKRVLIILGSQGSGVSPHLSRHAEISLCIERTGQTKYPYNLVDSLNVNSALSCILYEMTRK